MAINKNRQEDTGAWLAFFSLGLEKGKGESFLGLEKVDYKIEDGHLYRYTAAYGKTWTKLTPVESHRLGNWLALRIPKYQLLHPKTKIQWRVALFPKGYKEPLKLPTKGPASLDQYKSIGIQAYRGQGLPLDLALATSYQNDLELAPFVSGDRFDLPSTQKKYQAHSINTSLDQLIEPQPGSIFVGGIHAGPKPLSEEVAAAHRAPNVSNHYVFDLPQLKNDKLNQWLNQARATSVHLISKSSYFILDFSQNLPQLADGGIYHWQGDLQSAYDKIKAQRKTFKGPLWYFYHPNQKNWDPSILKASQKIWAEHQLMPFLSPQYGFEKCSHQLFSDVLWQKHCTLNYRHYPPKPNTLQSLKSMKLMAPEVYLRKLLAHLQTHAKNVEVSN